MGDSVRAHHRSSSHRGAKPVVAPSETQRCLPPMLVNCLQRPGCVVFFFCSCAFLQGLITNGCVNSNLATLEKRYQLRSIETGLIGSLYSVSSLVVLLPVTHFGQNRNKPLFMAFGTCILGVGSLIMAMPYFVGPPYSFSHPEPDTCSQQKQNSTTDACAKEGGSLRNYKWFFWIGNFLSGVGTAPYFTLGIAYLDENFHRSVSSKYIAAFQASAIVGPATGFVLNGHFLKYYVDQGIDPQVLGLNRDSSAWVGAWWMGFLYAGILCFAVALPVSVLPKELPEREAVMAQKQLEENQRSHANEDNLRDTVWALIQNKPFVFVCFAGAAELMVASGLSSFLVKMLQAQFSMTASTASMIMGSVTIPTGMIGILLGGMVISKYQMAAYAIVRMCVTVLLLPIVLITVLLFHCNNIPYKNLNYTTGWFHVNDISASLMELCNYDCSCSATKFNPVCGTDGYTYYSPCFAGCHTEYNIENKRVYSNCYCINSTDSKELVPGTNIDVHAVRDKCPTTCSLVNVFIPVLAGIIFATFFLSTPAVAATLRCIPESYKSVGLGVEWIIVRIFGLIPAGAAFGHTIDGSCALWEETCDAKRGACAVYDNRLLNRNVYFLILSLKLGSFFFFGLALRYLRQAPRKPLVAAPS
ncbi:solute carrier organic anion transporter family member 4A1-like [Ornithodoros turicata]|uniref:solute carrier organic anion transporter family member 4A1-like n=1 Tax=Ornithodoros turicata TaxID=34597 RepID=UPI003139F76C